MFYLGKLSWYQDNEKGVPVQKSKSFFVEAETVSDAETKLVKFASDNQLVQGSVVSFDDSSVQGVAEAKVVEFINYDDNSFNWWEINLGFLSDTGKVKKFIVYASGDSELDLLKKIKSRYSNDLFFGFKISPNVVDPLLISQINNSTNDEDFE